MKKMLFSALTVFIAAFSVAVFSACNSSYETYDDPDRYYTGSSPQGQVGGFNPQQGQETDPQEGGSQQGGMQQGSGTENFVAAQQVSSVEVDWDSGNVSVSVSDSADNIFFYDAISASSTYSGEITENLRLHYMMQGRKLLIKFAASGAHREKDLKKDLFITVPSAKKFDQFEVGVSYGSMTIENLTASDLELDTVSGAILLKNFTGNDVSLDSDSGAITLSNVIANDVTVETRSGSVKIEGVSFNELSVDTDSGNIEWTLLKDFGFTLEFETQRGNFNDYFGLTPSGKNIYRFGDGFSEVDVETKTGNLTLLSETYGGNQTP